MPVSPDLAEASTSESTGHLSRWVGAIALIVLAALAATSSRYGYHPDEMYFIVSGGHPAFGYPDQPPLVPLLSHAVHAIAPGSLLVLRLPSAMAAAVTIVVSAVIAREVGGDPRAQVIAAGCTACSGFALAACHIVSTTTFDLLSTSILCWLVIRAVRRHSGGSLFAAGVVAGIGSEAKPQVAFVAVALVAGLAVTGPRWPLRSPYLAAGIGAALILAAPYAIWQATHGWPQLTVAAHVAGTAEDGRAGFVPFQLVMVSPLLVPVWIAGLGAPFHRHDLRPLRSVPAAYAILAVAYLAGDGKAYYLASLYPAVLGLGAVPVADWISRRHATLRTAVLGAAVALSVALNAYLALPLVPATSLPGSAVMSLNPDQGETVGWPQFIDTVSRAWQVIPTSPPSGHHHLHKQLRRGGCHRRARSPTWFTPGLQRP